MMRSLIRHNRDLRVDVFRGFALFCIFISHMPDHVLWVGTIQVLGPSDATETFIFLAGYSAAFAYGNQMDRQGYAFAAMSLLMRVWQLYLIHIFMFVAFLAQVSWTSARFANSAYLDEVNVGGFLEEAHIAVLDAMALRLQPAFMDILPLYIVVLLLFMLMLPLLRTPLVLLGLSGVLYLAVRFTRLTLTTTTGDWFFNPFAWQFLFMIGASVARLGPTLGGVLDRYRRPLLGVAILGAVAGLVISAVWRVPAAYALLPEPLANAIYTGIDKSRLHPARLLHFLAIAYLVSRAVPRDAPWLSGRLAAPFALCGQNGLPVFALGVFLSFLGRLVMQEFSDGIAAQLSVAAAGWAICVALSTVSAWHEGHRRAPPRPKEQVVPSTPLAATPLASNPLAATTQPDTRTA